MIFTIVVVEKREDVAAATIRKLFRRLFLMTEERIVLTRIITIEIIGGIIREREGASCSWPAAKP